MRKDAQKPAKLSVEEQRVAEKMINTDITKDIPMTPEEWEDLVKLLKPGGVIINSSFGETTVTTVMRK